MVIMTSSLEQNDNHVIVQYFTLPLPKPKQHILSVFQLCQVKDNIEQ